MTIQTIGIGASANDGTGDTLRTAGGKLNSNWAEFAAQTPAYVAGRWYCPLEGMVAAGTANGANTLRLIPFVLKRTVTISDLGCRVATTAVGSNILLGIYANNSSTGNPTGLPVVKLASAVAGDTATAVSGAVTGTTQTLNPGIYWMAWLTDNATVACQTINGSATSVANLSGSTTLTSVATASAGSQNPKVINGTTYASGLPDLTSLTPSDAGGNAGCVIYFKAA